MNGGGLGQQGWPEVTKGPRSHFPCSGYLMDSIARLHILYPASSLPDLLIAVTSPVYTSFHL